MYNKIMADELFHKEAILIGNRDVIPMYRVIELFGESAANSGHDKPGTDWNLRGCGESTLEFLTESGFMKVVTYVNLIEARAKEKNAKK